jgi:NAD(P)-dependent dehydrogenase (short-subunit alcohol dehydrogenase family)
MPTVLITGCDRGLGAALAEQYAADGWKVIATCLDAKNGAALASRHSRLALEQLDVGDLDAIERLAKRLAGESIDVLLSNAAAGINFMGGHNPPFGKLDFEAWQHMFRVNTLGPIRLAECFVGHVERSTARKMVFISSRMGSVQFNRTGGAYGYRSSKAALNAAARSMAVDLLQRRITVLVIHPGNAKTYEGRGTVEVQDSVSGVRGVIARASLEDTGSFVSYDGQALPW